MYPNYSISNSIDFTVLYDKLDAEWMTSLIHYNRR